MDAGPRITKDSDRDRSFRAPACERAISVSSIPFCRNERAVSFATHVHSGAATVARGPLPVAEGRDAIRNFDKLRNSGREAATA